MKIINLSFLLSLVLLAFSASAYSQETNFNVLDGLYSSRDFASLESHCIKILQNSEKSSETHLEALYFLSASDLFQGNNRKAITHMLAFEESHNLVSHLAYKSEPDLSIPESSYIYIDARFLGLYYELGKFYFTEREDYKKAYSWLIRAKSSKNLNNDMMFNFFIGTASSKLGRYDEARKYYNRQLKNNPDEYSALYNIACTYALEQNRKEAIIWLEKAISQHEPYREEAKNDIDLISIRNTKEFKNLTTSESEKLIIKKIDNKESAIN